MLRLLLILSIWGVLAIGGVLTWFARDLPRPETALDAARRPGLSLQDRTGHVFATYGDLVGEPLRLSQLPHWLPEAAVSVEDRRFYHHSGIDPIGILRAISVNLRSGHLVQGGSTITQQVAKTLFLTNARTLRRKVQELMLTLWLEHSFSKQEILEIWLNRVYLGSGAWGVDAAARVYFGVTARKLSLWQCAVLAGLPRAPSRFNPRADPAAAAARGREVLAAMTETGDITKEQAAAASAAISFPPPPAVSGWFADWVAERSQTLVPSRLGRCAPHDARPAAASDGGNQTRRHVERPGCHGRRRTGRRDRARCCDRGGCGPWSVGATTGPGAFKPGGDRRAGNRARRSNRSSGSPPSNMACGRAITCWMRRCGSAVGARKTSTASTTAR